MTTLLFIHSAGRQDPGEGSSRLVASLHGLKPPDLSLEAPLMPHPDAPEAALWIAACDVALTRLEDDVVAVGHSLGGSVLLQSLGVSGVPDTLRGVVLLATPFWGAAGWEVDDFVVPAASAVALAGTPMMILHGTADETVAADHPGRYRSMFPHAQIHSMEGIDHEAAGAAPPILSAVSDLLSSRMC